MAVEKLKAADAHKRIKNLRREVTKRDHVDETLMNHGRYRRNVVLYDRHMDEVQKHLGRASVVARQMIQIEKKFYPKRKPKREELIEGEIPK